MRKMVSYVLSAMILVGSMAAYFTASAETASLQLSTKVEDYVLHTEPDKISEQDDSLVIQKPGYISVYQLKDITVKDVELSFNVKFEDVNETADFVFEVSVRNQDPAKYLWEKKDSFSLKFEPYESGGKRYIKSFFKKNLEGDDDGGFGFCDGLFEIIDGDTIAKDLTLKITTSSGNTTFILIADGVEMVNVVKSGYDMAAGAVVINTDNCKTVISNPSNSTPADPSNNVNLSTKLDDWTLQKCPELASEQGDSMVIDNHDATSHYILNDVLKKDIVLKFKVKFDEITQENNKIFFEVAFRNQNPTDLLWQRNDFYSLMFCPLMVGEKKYVKAYFREAISGDEFGFVDDLIEIVDGSTPEMNIEVSAITEDSNTTFKLLVNGVERVNTTKEGYDKAAGAVVLETLKCKTVISPFVNIEPSTDETTGSDETSGTTKNDDNQEDDDTDLPKTSDITAAPYALIFILIAVAVVSGLACVKKKSL